MLMMVFIFSEGSLLHKNRPDLIPQLSVTDADKDSRPSTSSNAFDPHWYVLTIDSVLCSVACVT